MLKRLDRSELEARRLEGGGLLGGGVRAAEVARDTLIGNLEDLFLFYDAVAGAIANGELDAGIGAAGGKKASPKKAALPRYGRDTGDRVSPLTS
jgi:hypothetical protein